MEAIAFFIAGIYLMLIIVIAKTRPNKKAFSLVPFTVALCAWLLFGWIEHDAKAKGINIRVDLLLTGPLILLINLYPLLHFTDNHKNLKSRK